MSRKIIKFNIGGTRYEVSQSLLESYPDSMLTKSVNEQWHEDPTQEIFVERDGDRFRYILDYMRDGKISLPASVTKAAVVNFFGLTVVESLIDDTLLQAYPKYKKAAQNLLERWEVHEVALAKCRDIVGLYERESPSIYEMDTSNILETTLSELDVLDHLFIACNKYLEEIGLCLVKLRQRQKKGGIWIYEVSIKDLNEL